LFLCPRQANRNYCCHKQINYCNLKAQILRHHKNNMKFEQFFHFENNFNLFFK
jgi:hypothetical protein